MDSLVGYGSDSDEDEQSSPTKPTPPPGQLQSKPGQLQSKPGQLQSKPGPSSQPEPSSRPGPSPRPPPKQEQLFPMTTQETSSTSLNISDDEDTAPLPPRSSSSAPIPKKKPLPKLSELIERAQIVSVRSEELQVEGGALSSLLPAPRADGAVRELELEHLRKGKRAKKDKKKIFALDLADLLDDEDEKEEEADDKKKKERPVKPKSGSGLFSVLPQPKNCKIGTKSTRSVVSKESLVPKKSTTFLQPRTLKRPAKKTADEEDEDEEAMGSSSDFFSFSKSERESRDLEQAAKSVKLDTFTPKPIVVNTPETQPPSEDYRSIDSLPVPDIAEENEGEGASTGPDILAGVGKDIEKVPHGFRDLAFHNTEIIDVNQEIPSTEEWALRHLHYEEEERSGSKCPVQGKARSKNQIGYLAWQAKEREVELKNQWSQNRANKHATQSKYGFR